MKLRYSMKKKSDQQTVLLEQQVEEWKSKYLRALADYQNLERRNREEKKEVHRFANEVLLARFLSAIDTLRLAKDHIHDTGLDLAFKEFVAILAEQGVQQIQTAGVPFNPHEMECIDVIDGPEGLVIEETLPGYRLNGKVLRVAQVKVGKRMNQSAHDKSANKSENVDL